MKKLLVLLMLLSLMSPAVLAQEGEGPTVDDLETAIEEAELSSEELGELIGDLEALREDVIEAEEEAAEVTEPEAEETVGEYEAEAIITEADTDIQIEAEEENDGPEGVSLGFILVGLGAITIVGGAMIGRDSFSNRSAA